DGYTQPGAMPNTNGPFVGTNAQIKVELDGSQLTGGDGLFACGFNARLVVRGLAIFGFRNGTGINVCELVGGAGAAIEGNFVGLDAQGNALPPAQNNLFGVSVNSNPFGGSATANVTVGGTLPAQRNVISGNRDTGVRMLGFNHRILGNLIGTDPTLTQARPNARDGVDVRGGAGPFSVMIGDGTQAGLNVICGNGFRGILAATNAGPLVGSIRGNVVGCEGMPNGLGMRVEGEMTIGGDLPDERNAIGGNTLSGISLAGFRTRVAPNFLSGNGQAAVTLRAGDSGVATGRLPNDADDADAPANRGQNFPEILAYAADPDNTTITFTYRVDTAPANATYPLRIDFYKAQGDELDLLVVTDTYTAAEAQTSKSLTVSPPFGAMYPDETLVAIATDADGNSSEVTWYPVTLTVLGTDPAVTGTGGAYRVLLRAEAPVLPIVDVDVSDGVGGQCRARLEATATPGRTEGSCEMSSNAPNGSVTLSASIDVFRFAFGNAQGGNATATGTHAIQNELFANGFE
ncbi:MAG TPA: hypothetical protein VFO79_13335, partial [Xanthomonadales bacterium]|nr:hypothetical protein [Xanthomonadales bacterium]